MKDGKAIKTAVFAALLLIAVMNLGLRAPGLYEYLAWDEGNCAFVASQMLEGRAPYVYPKIDREPMSFFVYALSFEAFGERSSSVRLMGMLWVLAALIMVFAVGRELAGPVGGLASAFFFGLSMGGLDTSGMRTNTEVFMTLPSAAAYFMALLAVKRDRPLLFLAAGAAVGLNATLKFNAVFDLAGISAFLALDAVFFSRAADRLKRLTKGLVLLGSGFSLGVAPSAAYLAYKGALGEAWRQVFLWRFEQTAEAVGGGGAALGRLKANWLPALKAEAGMAATAVVGIALVLVRRHRDELLIVIWFLFSLAAVSFNGWFGVRYLPFLLPSTALLAGYCVYRFAVWRPMGRTLTWLAVAAFAVYCGYAFYEAPGNNYYYRQFAKNFTRWKAGEISEHDFHKAMQADVTDFYEAGRYVREHAAPSDYVFYWTNSGEFLWATGRTPSSWYTTPLTAGNLKEREQRQKEIVYADVKRNVPQYFGVWQGEMRFTLKPSQSVDELERFGELNAFLDENYELDRIFGRVMLYRYTGGEQGVPRTRSVVLFPERMSPTIGHMSSLGWVMYADGSMSADIEMPHDADVSITVNACGTPSGGIYPVCEVLVDGREAARLDVGSEALTQYVFGQRLDAGPHNIELRYTNDSVDTKPGQDRNLYIDWVLLRYKDIGAIDNIDAAGMQPHAHNAARVVLSCAR